MSDPWKDLRHAAVTGDLELLRRELAKGPDVNDNDNDTGQTLLLDLCGARGFAGSDRLACFHLLIEAGADPTKMSTSGWFPLLYAAGNAYTELCAALLASSAQADLNRAGRHGWTPLHLACRSRSSSTAECVALLLSRGAAVNARDESGSTPLDHATQVRRRHLFPALLRAGAALPAPGTPQWERIQRSDAFIYLRKVAAAGGYRNYARDHLNALSGIFVPKFSRVLPPEMVRRVVEYAFDVGGH